VDLAENRTARCQRYIMDTQLSGPQVREFLGTPLAAELRKMKSKMFGMPPAERKSCVWLQSYTVIEWQLELLSC